jgi:hypothetical protein
MEPYFSLGQFQKNWKVVPSDPSFKGEHGNKTFVDVLEADTSIPKRRLQSNRVKQMIPPNMLWSQMVHSSYALVMDLCY